MLGGGFVRREEKSQGETVFGENLRGKGLTGVGNFFNWGKKRKVHELGGSDVWAGGKGGVRKESRCLWRGTDRNIMGKLVLGKDRCLERTGGPLRNVMKKEVFLGERKLIMGGIERKGI